MGKEFNYTRIFETSALNPLTAYQAFNTEHFIILYIGYPTVETQKKLQQIRDYANKDPHCWSHQFDDNTMLRHIEHFKSVSRYIESKCKETGITFYDTSSNFLRVFNQAYSDIMELI